MSGKVLIKKYANRRLYDTEKSRHITLAEVRELICEDRDVLVVDVNTGEDMTAFILAQIVLEEARKKKAFLPVPFLYLLIKYGDNVLSEFFEKYLQQILTRYLEHKTALDEQFKKALDFGMGFSDIARKGMTGMTPFHPLRDLFSAEKAERNAQEKD